VGVITDVSATVATATMTTSGTTERAKSNSIPAVVTRRIKPLKITPNPDRALLKRSIRCTAGPPTPTQIPLLRALRQAPDTTTVHCRPGTTRGARRGHGNESDDDQHGAISVGLAAFGLLALLVGHTRRVPRAAPTGPWSCRALSTPHDGDVSEVSGGKLTRQVFRRWHRIPDTKQ
jgi:hypothetical protein